MTPNKDKWLQTIQQSEKIKDPQMIKWLSELLAEVDGKFAVKTILAMLKAAVHEDNEQRITLTNAQQLALLDLMDFLVESQLGKIT